MGLRAFSRRHPWVFWPGALIGGSVLLLAVMAAVEHRRGMARLRAVVAEQRAAGIGFGPEAFLAHAPPVDEKLQEQAWKLFGTSATWPGWSDDIANRGRSMLREGAAWRPEPADTALLQRAGTNAAAMRALLADDRLALSIAGWARRDLADGIGIDRSRVASVLVLRALAEWLTLAGACGDARAEADLRRLRRALSRSPCLIDLMMAATAQRALSDLRFGSALRGQLSLEDASSGDPEEIGKEADALAAFAADCMLGTDSIAEHMLADPPITADQAPALFELSGLIDWVRGPDDLAQVLVSQESQLRGGGASAVRAALDRLPLLVRSTVARLRSREHQAVAGAGSRSVPSHAIGDHHRRRGPGTPAAGCQCGTLARRPRMAG